MLSFIFWGVTFVIFFFFSIKNEWLFKDLVILSFRLQKFLYHKSYYS